MTTNSHVIHIKPEDLPEALLKEASRVPKMIARAIRGATMKLKAYLVMKTDELGITDLGTYKASFMIEGNSVVNIAPHAPIVEEGARPHPVSEEGVKAIAEWVKRKLTIRQGPVQEYEATVNRRKGPGTIHGGWVKKAGPVQQITETVKRRKGPGRYNMPDEEALQIAQAIAWSIRRYGQKGRYVMKDAIPKAREFLVEELQRQISRYSPGGAQ